VFHGWRIVGIGAAAQGVSAGTTFYAYGILVKPLAAEFAVSRLVVTLGLTLLILVQGLISPLLGRALDRVPVRVIMALGVLLQAAGLAALSVTTEFWQVAALFATAIAVGSHMFGPLATVALVTKWFARRRGRALGLLGVGVSVGGILFPPIVAALIASHGWRGAVLLLAAGTLLLVIPIWLFVVSRPEDVGLSTDGDPIAAAPNAQRSADVAAALSTRELLRSRNFWSITATVGLIWLPVSVLLAHLVPYATDLGVTAQWAAILMSVYAGSSAIGRVGFGMLADRFDKRVVMGCVLAIAALSWANLLGDPPFARLLIATAAMGLGVGGVMPLWGSLASACFGRASIGHVMGLMNPLMLPFNLVGAPVAAYVYDQTGSYGPALAVFLAAFALAAATLSLLRLPAMEPGTDPVTKGAYA
jgi:MFS family permease